MSGPYRTSTPVAAAPPPSIDGAVIADAKLLCKQLMTATEPVEIGDWLVKSSVISAVRLQIADGGATVHIQVYWFPSGQRMTFTRNRNNDGSWSAWEQ